MRNRVALLVVGVILVSQAVAWAVEPPPAVSPGSADARAVVESRCPTFSWGTVPGASGYELVVYRVREDGSEADEALREILPAAVGSWTPALDRCLERGQRYGWAVRAIGSGPRMPWSDSKLFRVATGPSIREVEGALATLRSYAAAEAWEASGPATRGSALDAVAPVKGPGGGLGGSTRDPTPQTPTTVGSAQLEVEAPAGPSVVHAIRGIAQGVSSAAVVGEAAGAAQIAGLFYAEGLGAQGLVASGNNCCDHGEPTRYAHQLTNESTGADPDVLALVLTKAPPSTRMNYIGFFAVEPPAAAHLIGGIEGDGRGGIHFKGSHLTLAPTDVPLLCNQASHAGRFYFDQSLNEPCFCDGSSRQQIDGGGACV